MTAKTMNSLKTRAIEKLEDTFDRLASEQDEDKAAALVRAISATQNLILNAKFTLSLTPTLNALDDTDFLMKILTESLAQYPAASKRALLRLKGQLAFTQQIKDAGGTFTSQQVADLLSMKPDAVRKRRMKGKLIAIPEGDHYVYPTFQFDRSGVINNLPELLATLQTKSSVDAIQFFLIQDPDLGMSPLDALKQGTDHDFIFRLAKQFGRQVAR